MTKDYAHWHPLKAQVNARPPRQNFHEREVWWCSLGENVGFEEDGKNSLFERPVLILRKFNKELFVGVPLTSKEKKGNPYYVPINVNGAVRSAIISQVRVLSSRRLLRKIDRPGKLVFTEVVYSVTAMLQKTIPADFSAGSPVPSGNLYGNSTADTPISQYKELM